MNKISRTRQVAILQIGDDELQIDLNYPLAGQSARYSVKIVELPNTPEYQGLH